MHHSFIDRYSDRASRMHRADPRLKIVVAGVIIVAVVTTPTQDWPLLAGFAALLAVLWGISSVPPSHLFRRMLIVVPFTAFMALGDLLAHGTAASCMRFGVIAAKAALAVGVITLLTSTTRFPSLLRGFAGLGMPRILNATLAFLYRYIFIIIDEAERLSIGRRSRQFSRKRLLAWLSKAWMIGTLLLRSFERSERVYRAMLARGFSGDMRTIDVCAAPSAADAAAAIVIGAAAVAMRFTFILMAKPEIS